MDPTTEWPTPPGDHAVPEDEVHVWRAGPHWPPHAIDAMTALLSADERGKVAAFRFDVDRRRCVVGRSLLRLLLGRCLRTPPQALRFVYGARGKPALAASQAVPPLAFNVSHSGDFILIALTNGRAVGVDVERMRPEVETEALAQRFFSAHERAVLAPLDAAAQREAFFACWARKEAYIKATGDGLSLPLHQFDVTVLPGEGARLVATRPDPAEADRWVLCDVDVGPGHRAAVAVERGGWRLRTWDWFPDQADTASLGACSTAGAGFGSGPFGSGSFGSGSLTRNQIT